MAMPLPERVSRLEGAYEQVADRLNGIDVRLAALDQKADLRFDTLDKKIDVKFTSGLKLGLSLMLGQTTVILGAIAAAAFALHH